MVYGISHGLILLPVVLSLIGSPPLEEEESPEEGGRDEKREDLGDKKEEELRILSQNGRNNADDGTHVIPVVER